LHGYSLERRVEAMGRCTSDMCLHLLGGTQRLLVKNRHQHPTIVVLACSTEVQGASSQLLVHSLRTTSVVLFLLYNIQMRENSYSHVYFRHQQHNFMPYKLR
jgi:hypothetical protein